MAETQDLDENESPPEGWVDYHDSGKIVPPETAAEFDRFVDETDGKLDYAKLASWIVNKDNKISLVVINESLDLRDCERITALPNVPWVVLDAILWGCSGLTSLPVGFFVSRNLSLRNCISLTGLPEGLRVGWTLDCTGCTKLLYCPTKMGVGEDMFLTGTALAKSWRELPKLFALEKSRHIFGSAKGVELSQELMYKVGLGLIFDEKADSETYDLYHAYFDFPNESVAEISSEASQIAKLAVDMCIEVIGLETERIAQLKNTIGAIEATKQIKEMTQKKKLILVRLVPVWVLKRVYGSSESLRFLMDVDE